MKFPDEYQLVRPTSHYFEDPEYPEAVEYVEARNELFDRALAGKLFIKFVSGDRKGSIARLTIDPRYEHLIQDPRYGNWRAGIRMHRRYSGDPIQYEVENNWFNGVAKWDKPKRSCQVQVPDGSIVFLPNYEGPTVYELFDRKAAKEELLKNPDQIDIDGKSLAVGDKVLYINARYYGGMELCHGTIQEFKVSADSRGHSFTTIVKNDRVEDEISTMSYPFQMIWKK